MRLHRFYTAETIGLQKEITIRSAEFTNQVRRVFRLKSGDSVILFDGSGSDYECTIADFGKEDVTVNVVGSTKSRFMPSQEVILYAAVVKKDTFEWIIEKATELGITRIVPVIAERTEKKALNMERLTKIATEASEQSGRGDVPAISPIVGFKECLESLDINLSETFAFDLDGELFEASDTKDIESVSVFIGPEGGWSPREIELFHSKDIPIKSLGTQVLRAETAVIATLSLVMLGK